MHLKCFSDQLNYFWIIVLDFAPKSTTNPETPSIERILSSMLLVPDLFSASDYGYTSTAKLNIYDNTTILGHIGHLKCCDMLSILDKSIWLVQWSSDSQKTPMPSGPSAGRNLKTLLCNINQ